MGTNETTNSTIVPQMGPAEMAGLARRLHARGDSVLLKDQPHQAADLRTAASLIERLVHVLVEVRHAADETSDETTERHLRKLLGGA
jgi:hypothetical protein